MKVPQHFSPFYFGFMADPDSLCVFGWQSMDGRAIIMN
jgi:hypothetical protein